MKVQAYRITITPVEAEIPPYCPGCGELLTNDSVRPISMWGRAMIDHGLSGLIEGGVLELDDGGRNDDEYIWQLEHGNHCGRVLFDGLDFTKGTPMQP